MTELDPSIILKAFATPQLDVAGLMEKRDALQQRTIQRQRADALYQQQQAVVERQNADTTAQRGVIQQYGTDPEAARRSAFATGNPDLVAQLDKMDDSARQRAFEISQHTAPLLLSLKRVPPEQRAQALAQIAPQLQQSGFSPEHIAQVGRDLSDEALVRIGTSAMTIAEYTASRKPVIVGEGQQMRTPEGELIASGPDKFHAITTPAGGTTTIYGAPGAAPGGAPRSAVTGAAIEQTATSAVPGLTVTSRQRSAGHNTEVGGVAGSYHLTDQARDFTPPPGMSMQQLHSRLRQAMPGFDVINDGDHVHVEPGPRMSARGGPVTIKGQPKPAEPATPLDESAIEYVAQQYMATGQMPPLGMGRQAAALRAQIIGRAAVLSKQQGISGTEAAGLHSDFKANSAALAVLQRNANQILAYERTAGMNAEQVLQTMGRGAGTTGMPIFNAWQQAGRKATGNADVSRFNLAVQTFATEYARVVSGATGGAVTSDSARNEISALINNAQTPQQLAAVIAQAKTEMANRRKGLGEQATALRQQLGMGGGQSAPPAGAVAMLRQNPGLRGQFDAKYGAGAAAKVLGR